MSSPVMDCEFRDMDWRARQRSPAHRAEVDTLLIEIERLRADKKILIEALLTVGSVDLNLNTPGFISDKIKEAIVKVS